MSVAAREQLADDLVRVGSGDRAALRRVYDATAAKLLGVCLRIAGGDRGQAEDALQESFVKIWQSAGRYDRTRASPITWLCLVARGTAIDLARARGRRQVAMDSLAEHAADAPAPMVIDGADRLAIDGCMDNLPADQRGAIQSAFYDGYAHSELADRSGVPIGTLKSRIRRGLMALRRCLDGE